MVNTPSSLGGIGGTTGLMPALTLGCGAIGGSATSENVGPLDLLNTRYIAYGIKELEEIRSESKIGDEKINSLPIDEIVRLIVKQLETA